MFCIPIIARNTEEALETIAKVEPLADVLEMRIDLMESFDLPRMIKASKKPVLVTYRSHREGGKGSDDPKIRTDFAISAIGAGAAFVDVELSLPHRWRERIFENKGGSDIIISTHKADGTPSQPDLEKILNESIATGADIVKIVTWANSWEDNLRVLELIPKAKSRGVGIAAFCMGSVGRISRVFSHLMGGDLTFVSLDEGLESASGQIPIGEMKKILEMLYPGNTSQTYLKFASTLTQC